VGEKDALAEAVGDTREEGEVVELSEATTEGVGSTEGEVVKEVVLDGPFERDDEGVELGNLEAVEDTEGVRVNWGTVAVRRGELVMV